MTHVPNASVGSSDLHKPENDIDEYFLSEENFAVMHSMICHSDPSSLVRILGYITRQSIRVIAESSFQSEERRSLKKELESIREHIHHSVTQDLAGVQQLLSVLTHLNELEQAVTIYS